MLQTPSSQEEKVSHTSKGHPGYFHEPHWKSMGLPQILRVTWQLWCRSRPLSPSSDDDGISKSCNGNDSDVSDKTWLDFGNDYLCQITFNAVKFGLIWVKISGISLSNINWLRLTGVSYSYVKSHSFVLSANIIISVLVLHYGYDCYWDVHVYCYSF